MSDKRTGEIIRERRKAIGMSADALADKIGVSRSTVFRYENGYIEKFPINKLVPIARVLQTTVAFLMGWTDDPALEQNMPVSEYGDEHANEAHIIFDSLSPEKKLEATHYLRFLANSEEK